ncbi:integrating conjugative element protein [Anopheles sinensis]|uniref:Integrating conjugative element protein n=1 Tax=Anopheles sinensis TaxID=74873 RepID=A0A084VD41_ANOSI|nr:integrating conjugative element protein [Anopheles sinensis]
MFMFHQGFPPLANPHHKQHALTLPHAEKRMVPYIDNSWSYICPITAGFVGQTFRRTFIYHPPGQHRTMSIVGQMSTDYDQPGENIRETMEPHTISPLHLHHGRLEWNGNESSPTDHLFFQPHAW